MREMILNHASLSSPNRHSAIGMLREIAIGMANLANTGVVEHILRSARYASETPCYPGSTLDDAYQDLRSAGARDEALFLVRLSTKAPLLKDIDPYVKDRFLRCEDKTLDTPNDGEPLVLCAINDGIAISFPTDALWDKDQLAIYFNELIMNDSIVEATETVDNLSRSTHADAIISRHRSAFREGLQAVNDSGQLWSARATAFPNLKFGPDVEEHLSRVNQGYLSTIVGKLTHLDNSAAQWPQHGGDAPHWETKVTDESNKVKQNRSLREYRRFQSISGSRELFYWHARYGRGGRIHLRFARSEYLVEIGYIGEHLPL